MNYEDFTFSPWEYELVPAWCEFQTFFSLLLLRCFLSYLLSQRLKGDPLHVLGVLCVCVCVCLFAISWAALEAYGGSQARGLIRAIAASLLHSHSNLGSKRVCNLYHSSWQPPDP